MANIIFDFDGTIADSLPLVIHLFERLMRDGQPISDEEVQHLRGMSLVRVAAELRIPPWKAPWLLARGRAQMRRHITDVPIFEGIADIIRQLHSEGHNLYVVSSNSARNIQLFLRHHDLDKEFIKVYGSAGLFGKTRLLRTMLRKTRLELDDTYYIGDEVRDVTAAKHSGIRVIAVTWGYNTEVILHEHHPDFMAVNPAGIVTAISA